MIRAVALEGLGVPRRTITSRCERGVWQTLLRGILLLSNAEPTDEHRIEAAILHGREGAMLTGIWALRRYGLQNLPAPKDVHILVPSDRKISSAKFVHVETTTRLPSPQTRQSIPVAPVHRAVLDAVRRLKEKDMILAIMAEAVQRGRCTTEALARELELGSSRGAAKPRRALIPLLGGARSVAEADAWHLWQRSGLPPCRWNVKIVDGQGEYIATPDGWADEVALAWEVDSRSHHGQGDDYLKTLARNTRYTKVGIVLLQTPPARLRAEPEKVLAELRAAYQTAQARPRPEARIST
ncbi:hypothetical protein [Amycolatopsis sp. NPDC059657]|uniref:hypothetical protein n=1 Tax=Amycolatopsis sp. NPDC059657 TaxID=3346899 RepID=UPI003672F62F